MSVLGSVQITAVLVVIGTLIAYFFIMLYHARMLVYEKQKRGLVRDNISSIKRCC